MESIGVYQNFCLTSNSNNGISTYIFGVNQNSISIE